VANGFKAEQVFAHRGMWSESTGPNTLNAFRNAHEGNFSIETDIRSSKQEIYISHDASDSEELLSLQSLYDFKCRFALNIKQDGLGSLLEFSRDWIEQTNSFLFDGSVPEMIKIKSFGFRHALRLSEYEKSLPWDPDLIWLDSFNSDWWLNNLEIEKLIRDTQVSVIVVSPELHGREARDVWEFMASLSQNERESISICTDSPLEFIKYVNS
jgi:hypothetical protein